MTDQPAELEPHAADAVSTEERHGRVPSHEALPAHGSERVLKGLCASPGIVIGRVQVVDTERPHEIDAISLGESEIDAEIERFQEAVDQSKEQVSKLRKRVAKRLNSESIASIFDYHLLILEDPMLIGQTIKDVQEQKRDAASLFNERVEKMLGNFRKIDDPYFRARSSDLTDVARRVLSNFGKIQRDDLAVHQDKTIIVAHDLTPSDTAHLDPQKVAGFITDKGGPTSHTAILARSLHIPAIVGLERATSRAVDNQLVVVDAISGRVILNPSEKTLQAYEEYLHRFEEYEERLGGLADKAAETPDGFHVDLAANIELPSELQMLERFGAFSIGLYRTEFLFLEDKAPTEEEQFTHYREALEAVGKENYVIFRTLDLGGDKSTKALPTIEEANPYLGLRAVRFCLAYPELFRAQLRALLRASAYGRARLMFPMISSIEELNQIRQFLYSVMEELDREGTAYDGEIDVGIMIEVPSAALMADKLAREVDFFSIGTNDLIQYTLAVDRGNDLVAYLYNPFDPSILRLVHSIIESAHRNGIVANLCGEMAGDPISSIILLGMGIDELSMAAGSIPAIKEVIRHFKLSDARDIAEEILTQGSASEVRRIINERILPVIEGLQMPEIRLDV